MPFKDKALFYEEVVECGPDKTKADLYKAARKWFADTYVNAEAVLQMDDPAGGKLIGKGVYNFMYKEGIWAYPTELKFTVAVDVKDGKYRYQVYDFIGKTLTNQPINFFIEYELMTLGDLGKGRHKLLSGVDDQAKSIIVSLKEAMAKAEKEDW